MTFVEQLRSHPRLFDATRSASRFIGRRGNLYESLRKRLSDLGPQWTFLQAGAHDGLLNDPFREFIVGSAAQGILVEPWPATFLRLRGNYKNQADRLSFFRCALTYPPQPVTFYTFTEEFVSKNNLDPILLSTAGLHPDHLAKQVKHSLLDSTSIVSMEVPGASVEEVMRLAGLDRLDALFLDLEGHESNILDNMNFDIVRPRLVVYESKHLGAEGPRLAALLQSQGFTIEECDDDAVAFRSL